MVKEKFLLTREELRRKLQLLFQPRHCPVYRLKRQRCNRSKNCLRTFDAPSLKDDMRRNLLDLHNLVVRFKSFSDSSNLTSPFSTDFFLQGANFFIRHRKSRCICCHFCTQHPFFILNLLKESYLILESSNSQTLRILDEGIRMNYYLLWLGLISVLQRNRTDQKGCTISW